MKKQSDKELKNQFLEGDEESFRALVKRHYYNAYRVARFTPFYFSEEDAEDIVQTVMLALYDKMKTVKNIGGFVKSTAQKKCIDVIRKREAQKRPPTVPISALSNPGPDGREGDNFNPPEDTEKRMKYISEYEMNSQVLKGIKDHMDKLGEPCGPLIKRRYFDEMSYKELGKSLDIPSKQIGSRLARCMARFIKNMEKDNSFWPELEELVKKEVA